MITSGTRKTRQTGREEASLYHKIESYFYKTNFLKLKASIKQHNHQSKIHAKKCYLQFNLINLKKAP